MSRWLVYLTLIVSLFAFPLATRAQSDNVAFDFVNIQIWPEYDRPSVLVIYDFAVSAETPLPVTVTLRIPANADLIAVAVLQNNNFLNKEYTPPTSDGQWLLVSMQIPDRETYRIEYYTDFSKSGQTRRFTYTWQGDYAVRTFRLSIQQPLGASPVQTDPIATTPLPASDGFTYYNAVLNDVAAGQNFSLNIRYDKDTDALSAESLTVQPSGGVLTPSQPVDWPNVLPWVLGGVGILLIVGGGLWYWQTGQAGQAASPRRRKRHAALREDDDDAPGDLRTIYCHQCGKRAQSGDRFCRACGTKLRLHE
ncbi:MAG: zinc ribbon domain-containing protein [Anaerolineales bacterium]